VYPFWAPGQSHLAGLNSAALLHARRLLRSLCLPCHLCLLNILLHDAAMRSEFADRKFCKHASRAVLVNGKIPPCAPEESVYNHQRACIKCFSYQDLRSSEVTVRSLTEVSLCPTPVILNWVELRMELREEVTDVAGHGSNHLDLQ
jgi:hypothetical protein